MSEYNYPGYRATPHGFLEPRPGSKGGYHAAEDLAAREGTPVYAEYSGRVFRSGPIHGYGMGCRCRVNLAKWDNILPAVWPFGAGAPSCPWNSSYSRHTYPRRRRG